MNLDSVAVLLWFMLGWVLLVLTPIAFYLLGRNK